MQKMSPGAHIFQFGVHLETFLHAMHISYCIVQVLFMEYNHAIAPIYVNSFKND